MSGFDLTIEFGGMCLFVPNDRENVVHVVLPHVVGHQGHDVRLFVDERYFVRREQIQEAGLGWEPGSKLVVIPLPRMVLDFSVAGQTPDAASIKGNGLAPISDHLTASSNHGAKNKVLKHLLQGNPQGPVKNRVDLRAGRMDTVRHSEPWTLGGVEGRKLAISADWIVGRVGQFPTITVKSADDKRDVELELAPPQGEEAMRVHLFNTMPDDTPNAGPGIVSKCEPADHFLWFYPAFGIDPRAVRGRDVPHFDCDANTVGDGPASDDHHHHRMEHPTRGDEKIRPPFGRRLTCVMGDGDPEP